MRDLAELTELEAELLNRGITLYPGGLGYHPDREPCQIAATLVEEGRLQRLEIDDAVDPETGTPVEIMITYRLTDEFAEEIRRRAADRAKGAGLN
jgi:hypothetical protein